jgi:hypothetical protein
MKKYLIVALLASLLAGCAHDSPCVPVYDSQGRLVHTNTCMKGTTEDNWDTAGAIAGGRRGSRPHVRDRRADPLIHPRPADTGASVEPVSALLRIIHMTTGQINSLSLAALRANRL